MISSAPSLDRHRHTRPRSAKLHLFDNGCEDFLLDVESGRIHSLPGAFANMMKTELLTDDPVRAELMAAALGVETTVPTPVEPPESVPVKALSLAVAQKCNLGCLYCYAQQGTFGGKAGKMPAEVAEASVDQLLQGAQPGEKITVAFMGGEPLTSRETLHAATRYAARQAAARGVSVGFTVTTNATLLTKEDIDLFQEYGFTLTISLDGLETTNDQLRPFASGKGSFDKAAENVDKLLSVEQRRFRLLARSTVTPRNLELPKTLTGLLDMGFDSVMFSPMLSAPSGQEEMQADDLDQLLEQLIECGEIFRKELRRGRLLPFENVLKTLKRIHVYERDQYPCGAGGGYMGVSAKGELYACHRFVNDEEGHMGNVYDGVDPAKQLVWLDQRNLQKQSPCTGCWARYLCSGSCHHEVINRGRPACNYIRGWLHYCLALYTELLRDEPESLRKILQDG